MAKLYIGNTAYKVMLGDNSGHIADLPTIVWNQLENPNTFAVRTPSRVTLTKSDDILTVTVNQDATSISNTNIMHNNPIVGTHKFYYRYDIKINNGTTDTFVNANVGYFQVDTTWFHNANVKCGEWNKFSGVITPLNSTKSPYYGVYGGGVYLNNGDTVQYRNIILIDLTIMFGAGNEPTSVAQFEQWFTDNIGSLDNYYPYNEGEEIKVKYLPKYM